MPISSLACLLQQQCSSVKRERRLAFCPGLYPCHPANRWDISQHSGRAAHKQDTSAKRQTQTHTQRLMHTQNQDSRKQICTYLLLTRSYLVTVWWLTKDALVWWRQKSLPGGERINYTHINKRKVKNSQRINNVTLQQGSTYVVWHYALQWSSMNLN